MDVLVEKEAEAMKEIPDNIIHFFERQSFVIVSTLDPNNLIHCSVKGVAAIESKGKAYIVDLYKANTFNNLLKNPTITITAVDEHHYAGYTLRGKAKIVEKDGFKDRVLKKWEKSVIQRISKRLIKNLKEERKTPMHPEAIFPSPQYLIEMEVEEIISLAAGSVNIHM
jgi:uncharacterized pyridoxamine 5'-phosphate oxidase family protein